MSSSASEGLTLLSPYNFYVPPQPYQFRLERFALEVGHLLFACNWRRGYNRLELILICHSCRWELEHDPHTSYWVCGDCNIRFMSSEAHRNSIFYSTTGPGQSKEERLQDWFWTIFRNFSDPLVAHGKACELVEAVEGLCAFLTSRPNLGSKDGREALVVLMDGMR